VGSLGVLRGDGKGLRGQRGRKSGVGVATWTSLTSKDGALPRTNVPEAYNTSSRQGPDRGALLEEAPK